MTAMPFVMQERYNKYGFIKWMSMASLFIYICSLFVLSYSDKYNIISKGLFLITVFFALLNVFISKVSFKLDYSFFALLLFIGYIILSSIWVVDETGVNAHVFTMVQLFALYIIVRLLVQSEKDLRIVLWAVFTGAFIMCMYTILFYGARGIISLVLNGRRIGGEINQSNSMGLYCTILTILSLYFAFWEKRYWCLLTIPLAIFILVGAGSRKSFLLLAFSTGFIFIFKSKKRRLTRLLVVACILIFAVFLILELADTNVYIERLAQIFKVFKDNGELHDDSLITRSNMIDYGFELFSEKPVFGYGPVQYEYYYYLINGLRRPPHSTYLQILVGYGLVGFSLFYGIYAFIIAKIIPMLKRNREYSVLIAVFVLLFLINDIGANMLNSKFLFIFIAVYASYLKIRLDSERR